MPAPMIPFTPPRIDLDTQTQRGESFYELMNQRRSIRFFSDDPVPKRLIETAILTASTAPSGAHKQPWTYVVTGDPDIKRQIRQAAEEEEKINYEGGRLPPHWREDLEPLGTDWEKPFLETVPWIVVLFEHRYQLDDNGERRHVYYPKESVGISAGLFIAALHNMGLATLTHTPSPMKFLTRVLGRPENERPFCLFPIGYPAEDAVVPDLTRKPLEEVMVEVGNADLDSPRRGLP